MAQKTNSPPKISVVIITLNSEHQLEKCLDSIGAVNEILIIDGGSTDRTRDIARRFGAKIFIKKWPGNFSEQKQFAVSKAKNNWVFAIDSDECLSPELRNLLSTIELASDTCAYMFPRQNLFLSKKVRFSGWQNDYVIRLFNRNRCKYDGRRVHEKIVGYDRIERRSERLIHDSYPDIETVQTKVRHYSLLGAELLDSDAHRKIRLEFPYVRATWSFFRSFFLQLGFLDGFTGLQISTMNFRYTLKKYDISRKRRLARKLSL